MRATNKRTATKLKMRINVASAAATIKSLCMVVKKTDKEKEEESEEASLVSTTVLLVGVVVEILVGKNMSVAISSETRAMQVNNAVFHNAIQVLLLLEELQEEFKL